MSKINKICLSLVLSAILVALFVLFPRVLALIVLFGIIGVLSYVILDELSE